MDGSPAVIDVTGYSGDLDDLGLAYNVSSSDKAVATVNKINGDRIAVFPESPGMVTITVYAADPTGRTTKQVFVVTVEPMEVQQPRWRKDRSPPKR